MVIICRGMQNSKWIELGNKKIKFSGCGKDFTINYFDLYRAVHILGTGHITCDCKHCGEPNYISGKIEEQLDARFIQQIPKKYNRFLKAY